MNLLLSFVRCTIKSFLESPQNYVFLPLLVIQLPVYRRFLSGSLHEIRTRKQTKVNNQAQIWMLYDTDCKLNVRLNPEL